MKEWGFSMTAIKKFRPVLSHVQIIKIIELAKLEQPITVESKSLLASLSPFLAKIEAQGVQAAYTATQPAKKAPEKDIGVLHGADNTGLVGSPTWYDTKELFWEACYNKYKETPTLCTLDEIEGAQEHKYLNDLMTPIEVSRFEEEALNDFIDAGKGDS